MRTEYAVAALFFLAFALRASLPEWMEFKHDEAVAWVRAMALMQGVEFPTTGLMSSKGIENFPLFIYLVACAQLLIHSPEQFVYVLAFLNSLALLLIYGGCRRLFTETTAQVACLFYAVSPAAILLSRKIWAQDLLPFWSCALFYCGAVLLTEQENEHRWAKRFCSLALGLFAVTSFQIHYAGVFLCTAYGLILLGCRERMDWRFLCLGLAIGAIPAIPFVLRLLDLPDVPIAEAQYRLQFRPKDLLNFFVRQVVDEDVHALLGRQYRPFIDSIRGYAIVRYLMSGLVMTGLAITCREWKRSDRIARRNSFYLLALAAVPLAILGASRLPLVPSYFAILYPLPFIFAAHGTLFFCRLIAHRSRQFASVCLWSIVLLAGIYNLCCCAQFLRLVKEQGGTSGDYGIAYAQMMEAARSMDGQGASPLENTDLPMTVVCGEQPPRASHGTQEGVAAAIINSLRYPEAKRELAAQEPIQLNACLVVFGSKRDVLLACQRYPFQSLTPLQHLEAGKAIALWRRLEGNN